MKLQEVSWRMQALEVPWILLHRPSHILVPALWLNLAEISSPQRSELPLGNTAGAFPALPCRWPLSWYLSSSRVSNRLQLRSSQ